MIQYLIKIMDKETKRVWEENYDSYYLYKKRLTKLRYSKRLIVISQVEISE